MERLFSPYTRDRDLECLRELNLNVSTDELLSAERGFTYADLYTMLGNGDPMTWLTPHAAIVSAHGSGLFYWRYSISKCLGFTVDGKTVIAWASSHEALSEIADVVLRLVAASVVYSVVLCQTFPDDGALINATSLAYLMGQCQRMKVLSLQGLEMDETHCRLLDAYSRLDLEIELNRCRFTSAGASALVEVLGWNQGPTKLDYCEIDPFLLPNGLRGNSRLKSFSLYLSGNLDIHNRELLAIADAIRENKGLIEWHLTCNGDIVMNDETWGVICDSLKTHPTLEVLDLCEIYHGATTTPAVITSRIQVLLGMMEVNTSIHTIALRNQYSGHELFQQSVVPFLETNRFRQHVRAIQKVLPIPYRAKVLGRALLAVRSDPDRLWLLISGNAEVTFPSTTATTTRAASIPRAATAATTSNTDGASTAAAAATCPQLSSSIGASAVDIVATPTACQKRKTRP